jgi:Vps52 / Sac2 family
VDLLDNLESFLSTFQKDLSDVSGQISYLQARSRDIEGRLRSRKVRASYLFLLIHHPDFHYWLQKIEKPLSTLISGLTLPPNIVTTILDTNVGEPWIPAVADFERRLEALKGRQRVRAARDLGEVAEGLRIVVGPKSSSGADSRVTQSKMTAIVGSHEVARLFPRSPATYTCEYDHEYACNTNNCVPQVSSFVCVSTPARRKRRHRSAKGLRRCRTHIL